ncbi:hypothetical protein MJH54_22650, partial [Salmonella enterica subsp. enterica serovar Montevideo]|nr:hypothetical protein [Salmonella enterica subsp. enterica serovar Montevideo]
PIYDAGAITQAEAWSAKVAPEYKKH